MSENNKEYTNIDEEDNTQAPRLINPAEGLERPPERHGNRREARKQMRYGNMQEQLRKAAEARAQRSNKESSDEIESSARFAEDET